MDGPRIQWDADKASANHRKRGVSFLEAVDVLLDPLAATLEDRWHSDMEQRVTVVGVSGMRRLLRVTVVQRGTMVRIIPARRASARERHAYEEG